MLFCKRFTLKHMAVIHNPCIEHVALLNCGLLVTDNIDMCTTNYPN